MNNVNKRISPAGMIPQDWNIRVLRRIASVEYGISDPLDKTLEGGTRIIGLQNVASDGTYSDDPKLYVKHDQLSDDSLLKLHDILFCWRSGSKEHIGKTFLYNLHGEYTHVGFLLRIRCNSKKINPIYLDSYIKYIKDRGYFLGAKVQVNSTFNKGELLELPIVIPPLEEQLRIAEILSEWNKAIKVVQTLVSKLEDRKKGLMQRLLTGEVRFSGFNDDWEEVPLSRLLNYTPRKVDKPDTPYTRMGVRSHGKGTFIKNDVDPNSNSMSHLYKVQAHDLIVSITFAWEQAIAIVSPQDEGALVSHRFPTYEFKSKRIMSEFFRYLMLTERFLYQLNLISPGGAGRNRVMSKNNFLKLKVRIPCLEEQELISKSLITADTYIDLMQTYQLKLESQKKGLMQRLLTGEVRIKVED